MATSVVATTNDFVNTFDGYFSSVALDNVSTGCGFGSGSPSVASTLAGSSARTVDLYLDVFRKCIDICRENAGCPAVTEFRVINRAEDATLYLSVYHKYSRVSGKCHRLDPGVLHNNSYTSSSPSTSIRVRRRSSVAGKAALASSALTNSTSTNVVPHMQPPRSSCVRTSYNLSYASTSAHMHRRSSIGGKANTVVVGLPASTNVLSSSVVSRLQPRMTLSSCMENGGPKNVADKPAIPQPSTQPFRTRRRISVVPKSTYAYIDHGDCNFFCHHCDAYFWYEERLKGNAFNKRPEYHLCCGGGGIHMSPPREPPDYIKHLYENKHFMENIRAYNQMFSMTSFGAKIDESINAGRGPYVFKVTGQIYHWIGSLCPPPGETPRFLQLYIYDTDNEVSNRLHHFGGIHNTALDSQIVQGLIGFLDSHNELIQLFRTARDECRQVDIPEFKIRLYNAEGAKGYELPTSNTLGAIVFDGGVMEDSEFDVIIHHRDDPAQRVNKLHPSNMSLQFPLLFVYGQSGYHKDLK